MELVLELTRGSTESFCLYSRLKVCEINDEIHQELHSFCSHSLFTMYEISEDDFVSKLVKWADVIRRSFKEGAVDDIVTTRRLIDITKTFSIFGNKMKAITLCLERFDDETRDSFADLYTKVDAGASFEDITNELPAEDEIETENDTF